MVDKKVNVKIISVTKSHSNKQSFYKKIRNVFDEKNYLNTKFWVLKGVNAELASGEIVGIVGFSGSGKSTLCKMIHHEILPTSGKVETAGTTYLVNMEEAIQDNLCGIELLRQRLSKKDMNKKQLQKNIEDVIQFADLGSVMEQAVSSYSMEMRARLEISIGIQKNSDILIIDEALTLCDASFVKKCQDKFLELKEEGKTIVVVTPVLEQIERFCDKVIWLHFGNVQKFGQTFDVVHQYKKFMIWFTEKLSKQEQKAYNEKFRELQTSFSLKDLYTNTLEESATVKTREELKLIRSSLYKEENKKKNVLLSPFFFLVVLFLCFAGFLMIKENEQKKDSKDSYESKTAVMSKKRKQITAMTKSAVTTSSKPTTNSTTSSEEDTNPQEHLVKLGETLSGIAEKYKISMAELMDINKLTTADVYQGQILRLVKDKTEMTSQTTTDQAIEKKEEHVVSAGETLSTIAHKYHLTVEQLRAYNFLQSEQLSPGQILRLKQVTSATQDTTSDNDAFYTVQKGDTIYSIARRYNLTVKQIEEKNGLINSEISIGQVLDVAQMMVTTSTTSHSQNKTHTVAVGENLYRIAQKYGVSVEQLKEKNGLTSNEISVKQLLVIP